MKIRWNVKINVNTPAFDCLTLLHRGNDLRSTGMINVNLILELGVDSFDPVNCGCGYWMIFGQETHRLKLNGLSKKICADPKRQ